MPTAFGFGQPAGEDRQRFLQLAAGEGGAQAVVDAGAERQLRLAGGLARDVEDLGLGEDLGVVVRRRHGRGDERAGREQHVLVLDVLTGEAPGAAHGAEVAHRLLDGALGELRLLGQQLPLVRVVGEEGDGAAELVAGRVGAADDDGLDHHHELLGRELVALLLGRDEVGEEIVGRLRATVGD
jgi:hypothetical protein